MGLFAIADLHLGQALGKPMDIFGEVWRNHTEKLRENWKKCVGPEDTVLIPGDISWAMNIEEARPDLEFIISLPGRKILLSGNHDYWWSSVNRIRSAFPELTFLRNDFSYYGDVAICGTRGWLCPNDSHYTSHDEKLYRREQIRLRLSLNSAWEAGFRRIIVMTHYPPTNDQKEPSGFTGLCEEYGVEKVVYGHLHGEGAFSASVRGLFRGIEYTLVSADAVKFVPKKIL